jgi:uncharacterized pyridoxamine 5'-phosphate oxidase family protein
MNNPLSSSTRGRACGRLVPIAISKGGIEMKKHSVVSVLAAAALILLVIVLVRTPGIAGDDPKKDAASEQQGQAKDVDAVTTATGKPWKHGEDMTEEVEFIQKNPMGFLATVDEGMPRVRAWGFMKYEDGKILFGTDNTKDVFKQLSAVPYAEWISMDAQTFTTLRVFGKVVFVDDIEMKRKIIAGNAWIKDMYSGEKEKDFEVFYLTDMKSNWFSFTPPEGKTEKAPE